MAKTRLIVVVTVKNMERLHWGTEQVLSFNFLRSQCWALIFMRIMTVWAGDGNGDVDVGDGDDTDEENCGEGRWE